jgi:hypothetical protein
MTDKREVPHGSLEEAQVGESVIYGLLWGILTGAGGAIRESFNYLGADVHRTGEEGRGTGVLFDGLTVKMASGDYRITVERTAVRS